MKKAVTPKTDLYVSKDISPSITPYVEYKVDPNLCDSIRIIDKYFTLLNKKLSIGIGNTTTVVDEDTGDLNLLVISIMMSFKHETIKDYVNIIKTLRKQIEKNGCEIEVYKETDNYFLVKCLKYFDGFKPKKYITKAETITANLEIESALADSWK